MAVGNVIVYFSLSILNDFLEGENNKIFLF